MKRDNISIHALLAESDRDLPQWSVWDCISIHALLAESDAAITVHPPWPSYFYPRSPCGERPIVEIIVVYTS